MKSVKRAQIFTSYNDDKKLEREVDDFLMTSEKYGFSIIDIKYQVSSTPTKDIFSCMIYFTELV
ncbi:hypothetical protein [Treponema denticola]|uniref:Sporulation protein Cse60 n=1 Tax=Treponema denticola SP33 TaxID=999437 RepID=M2AAR2_TREDN|nr:hypothetical protein [Treponema denticola]EMB19551.1 hypothetical protein HMPREF9733_02651 [Treponema denticola SP33]EPF38102.1 hypothetical protein HMPREF9732_00067 [Treponema denticola SP32]